jgi:flagella basal body P-ring formation protein FlgA
MKVLLVLLIVLAPVSASGADNGVKRHEAVRVRLAVGGVAVETTAIATVDGRPGDVIRVRNKQTNKTYAVRVTGPGVADAIWR